MPAHRHAVQITSPLIESHLASLVLAGYSPRTLEARQHCLKAFARTIAPRDLAEATRADCETFLTSRPLKPESRRAYRSHLRGLYGWAYEEELIPANPMLRVPPVRVPKAGPRPISSADLVHALSRADARMFAWLALMSLAGLRCVEVAGLRPGDLQQTDDGAALHLRTCKGGGEAVQPAHPLIVEALGRLQIRDGAWWDCSPAHISRTVSVHLADCGIAATGHRLRHFAGSSWYRASGHDLLVTARLLRHRNVATSQIYVETDKTRPAEVVNAVQLQLDPAPLRLVDPGAA
jgi:integrase/recombinase XerC